MNRNYENKLSMYLTVQKVCKANKNVWVQLTSFADTFGEFEKNIVKINNAIKNQDVDFTGIAAHKKTVKHTVREMAVKISGALSAYASDTKDQELKKRIAFKRSRLTACSESLMAQRCQNIKDEASQVLAALSNYGINGSILKDFQAKINDFSSAISGPRAAITVRKKTTRELSILFKETDIILKDKLDMLVEHFNTSSVDFYKHYFDARIIVDIGIRHEDPSDPKKAA